MGIIQIKKGDMMKLLLAITAKQKAKARDAVRAVAVKNLLDKGCSMEAIEASLGRLCMLIDMKINNEIFIVIK